MHATRPTWRRVSKAEPCPVCSRPDWCGVAEDGSVAICMRVQSDRPTANGGHLHAIGEGAPRAVPTARSIPQITRRDDLERLAEDLRQAATLRRLTTFAESLGVRVASLQALGVGYHERRRSWSFPMLDDQRRAVGIRYRDARTGAKFAETGGREGLFVPSDLPADGDLFLPEGASDAAALHSLGFAAVGRPSCTGGTRYCATLARGRDAIVVADLDVAGRRGAEALASALAAVARTVRVISPPPPHKDVRDAVRAGLTADQVRELVEAQPIRRLRLQESRR